MPDVENVLTREKNRSYYNEIAPEYDAILDEEGTNKIIRKRVEEKFTSLVKSGTVLDFGGGTGRDLQWLISNNYKVIFCEPSENMRQKAIDLYKNNSSVQFLNNDNTDFTRWLGKAPFSTKLDAVLSDFAVINCIDDIRLLFKTLAQIIKPGGDVVALMLKHGYKKSLTWKIREATRYFFNHNPLVINIQFNGHKQVVYVYSMNEIKKASSEDFEIRSYEDLFEFTLFHFVRR